MIEALAKIFGSKTKAQEILLLLQDAKPVVRQGFYLQELMIVEKFCRENSLHLVQSKFKILLADGVDANELRKLEKPEGVFACSNQPVYSNKGIRIPETDPRPGMYFCYLSKDEEKAWLASYYELVGDWCNFGLVLGYPPCCVEFFCRNFQENKTDLELRPTNCYTNLSQRGEDCVLLSHFPCSSDCPRSIDLGKRYMEIIRKFDASRADELKQKLSLN